MTLIRKFLLFLLLLTTCYLLLATINLWKADYHYARGEKLTNAGQVLAGYEELLKAAEISPGEPVYLSEISGTLANLAIGTTSSDLASLAEKYSDLSISISPRNLGLWKTRIRVLYTLSLFDQTYLEKTIKATETAIKLAPTEPKLVYNLALMQAKAGETETALLTLEKAIEMKPNYEEARNALAIFYEDLGEKDKALEQLEIILKAKGKDESVEARIEKIKN